MTGTFSQIYADNVWILNADQESASGLGSTKAATGELVVALSAFLREIGCTQLVDIGCGDFNWMRGVEGEFDYLGIDVVPQLIEAHIAAFANDKRRFLCMDATRATIPKGDVAICREVLFHLSFRDGRQLLRNIKAAGFKDVLLTNDKSLWFNSDIRTGDFREINLLKSPFRFPKPIRELADDKGTGGECWRYGRERPCRFETPLDCVPTPHAYPPAKLPRQDELCSVLDADKTVGILDFSMLSSIWQEESRGGGNTPERLKG